MKSLIVAALVILSNIAYASDCYFIPATGITLKGQILTVWANIPCNNENENLEQEIVYVRHKTDNPENRKIAFGVMIPKTACNWGILETFFFKYNIESDLNLDLSFFSGYERVPLSYEKFSSYDFLPKCEVPPPVPKE